MLARVVAFDTTSHKSNLDLIGFVRAGLEAHEVPYRLSFDPTGQKANLHAHDRTGAAGGACLGRPRGHGAHRGQTRTEDPYTLRRQDGRLIERGTCDMKGFVAAVLAAVPGIKARKPTRPVHLLLTCDGEVGYHGARRLIEDLDDSGLRPDTCVVGEASSMVPIFTAKGRRIYRAGVRGHAAHSSAAHQGVNAVHAAAEAITWLVVESRRLAGPRRRGIRGSKRR
jgi:acetylornithine deacetylase